MSRRGDNVICERQPSGLPVPERVALPGVDPTDALMRARRRSQHGSVHVHALVPRHRHRAGDEEPHAGHGDADAEEAAGEPEEQALDQQLRHDARARRAERGSNRDLAAPDGRSRDQQVATLVQVY